VHAGNLHRIGNDFIQFTIWGYEPSASFYLVDGDKVAKVLGALAHKQRLDILQGVVREPLMGAELVDRLNIGTTGQLYHHIKALQGADLLVQEERGGAYSVPGHRALPLLLLLAAAADLLDTSDYIDMAAVRNDAGAYLGGTAEYDPHLLLWAVVDNCILEHRAGSRSCRTATFFVDALISPCWLSMWKRRLPPIPA
jgi:DNA gyrase subunit B